METNPTTNQPVISSQINPYIATRKSNRLFVLGILILLACAGIFTAFLWCNHWEPSGNDVWSHLYKAKVLYESIQEGNWYPLYSEKWYNGIQLYRYWAPSAYYCMSLLQWITGGDILHAYYLFAGVMIFFGGLPFLMTGRLTNRPILAAACSILWFFLPDNIRVFFCEGNMPRIITSLVIPYVIFFLWSYVRRKKRFALIGLMLSMALMTVSHLMLTALVGIGSFLFLLFDYIHNREFRRDAEALTAMVIGILTSGIWFIPAISGGMMSMGDSSSGARDLLTFPLSTSLNPMNRVTGVADTYYYGISVILVAVFGILLADKRRKAGFVLAIVTLLGTTPAATTITSHLPLGDFLWLARITALSYAFFFLSLLEWRTLKRKYALLLVALLTLDSGITLTCLPRYYTPTSAAARSDSQLLKDYTTQRANLMDQSSYGSYPSWGLSTGDDAIDYTYGWAWQGAATADNIMLMNEAQEHEQYLYVFDRSIEMGDDTVLVKKSYVKDESGLLSDAELCGYQLIDTTDTAYFFRKNTPEQFGVRTDYLGLTIGAYAQTLSIYYPAFTIGDSAYIDDYTTEELCKYQTLFLSGFEYHNQTAAENLLKEVAASGTRVVIDSAHLPENGVMQKEFLGMAQSQITFQGNLPNLNYNDQTVVTGSIPNGDTSWQTGYVSGLDQVLGYVNSAGQTIPFLGYNDSDPNIYYLGLNLAYFAINADNSDLWPVLNDAFGINYNQIPNRELIPLTLTITDNTITIHSEQADVNTTLAYQDNFLTEQTIYEENNLLYISDEDVTIRIVYPCAKKGGLVSLVGILLGIGMIIYTFRKRPLAQENTATPQQEQTVTQQEQTSSDQQK